MASAGLVASNHQVVKLAVGMASTSQIQAVPGGSSLPVSPSTKQKKQPAKNNGAKKLLRRPVSTNTPHPSTGTGTKGQATKGPKRTGPSPLRASTGSQGNPLRASTGSQVVDTMRSSTGSLPVAQPQKSTMPRKASTPPSTRGTHLKAAQPKKKRSSSLTRTATATATTTAAKKRSSSVTRTATATTTGVIKVTTGSKVAEEKELARKEGGTTTKVAKKKKDGVPPKRLSKSASVSNIKTAANIAAEKSNPLVSPRRVSVKIKTIKPKANSPESPSKEGKLKLMKKPSQTGSAKSPKKARSVSDGPGGAPLAAKPLSPKRATRLAKIPDISDIGNMPNKRSSLDSHHQMLTLSAKPTNKRASLDSASVSVHLSTSASLLMNQSERDHHRGRSKDDNAIKHPSKKSSKTMPLTYFGNPLVPIDIVETSERMSKLNLMHHKDALRVLGEIKNMKRHQLNVAVPAGPMSEQSLKLQNKESKQPKKKPELKVIQLLRTAGSSTSATLTMTGFKVEKGSISEQVNHDRSLVVSPFYLRNHSNSMVRRRLLGVFDGHAEHGLKFAEHCQQVLPTMLSRKLSEAFKKAVEDIAAGLKTREDEVAITKRVLAEAFVSMDESSPREATGGCTATVVYQQGQKVYVANTGDSRSFIAVYRKDQSDHIDDCPHHLHKSAGSTKQSKNMKFAPDDESAADARPTCARVVYISREDKPDLPGEQKRLEGWGGEIVPAEKSKSSKVKFNNNRPGKASATLSMSRSIGDWQFTPLGVIPDPILDVIDLKELVEKEKKKDGDSFVDDVCIFAVCVSDGMMIESVGDAEAVAADLASSLFSDDGHYPLCACQNVITKTSAIWGKRNKGKFRDDITIAMTVLRAPGDGPNNRF